MSGTLRITGLHAIEEALRRSGGRGRLMLARKGARHDGLAELAGQHGVTVQRCALRDIERIAGKADHRGALYLTEGRTESDPRGLGEAIRSLRRQISLVLLLDHITDPQNLGSILRSADQFAADLVILPSRRAAGITAAVLRASSGAAEHVDTIRVPNLVSSFHPLRQAGFWIYGAHLEGERLDRVTFSGRSALVLGSEGRGLGELVRRECDLLVRIPTRGRVDSLNVGAAAAIAMYEVRRSQGFFDDTPP